MTHFIFRVINQDPGHTHFHIFSTEGAFNHTHGKCTKEPVTMTTKEFNDLVKQGKTLLMVTHDKELARQVPRVIEIIDGNITRDEFVGGADWTGF